MAAKLIRVVVRDRQGIQYDGRVKAITSTNPVGSFDILPMHSNFITVVRQKLILHQENGSNMELNVENGLVRISNDVVDIYLGIK